MRPAAMSLEEVFLQLTGTQAAAAPPEGEVLPPPTEESAPEANA
jgi:hypothetical protein